MSDLDTSTTVKTSCRNAESNIYIFTYKITHQLFHMIIKTQLPTSKEEWRKYNGVFVTSVLDGTSGK
jgi:hypothetical protein